MADFKLFLLGSPKIENDGLPVKVETRKVMALMAYLAMMGESYRRDSLVNLLWPEYDLAHGRAVLRRTLSALNSALPESWLVTDRDTIGLNPQIKLWLDVHEFRGHIERCRGHGHTESEVCPDCLTELDQAANLYRDDFMSGFTLSDSYNFDDWQFFQTETLRQEMGAALGRLVQCHILQRDFETAIQCTRRRLTLDRLNEEVHGDLMRLYAWTRQRNSALRQFEECKKVLKSQLGVDPQPSTAALAHAIEANRVPVPPSSAVWSVTKNTTQEKDPSRKYKTYPEAGFLPVPQPAEQKKSDLPNRVLEGKSDLSSSRLEPVVNPVRIIEGKRIVTALFFEVSPQVNLTPEEEEEDRTRRVERFIGQITPILDLYGGLIQNQIGEGWLVVFGLIHVHENDPELALRAAMEIKRLSSRSGLCVTGGMTTGEVFARSENPTHTETISLTGNAIDMALFLAGQAQPGEIYAAKSTYQLTRSAFEFTPFSLSSKHKGPQVLVYQVDGLLAQPQKTRGIQGVRSPLVGREEPLVKLLKALEKTRTGSGQLALVIGEAGVGKSRLVEEFRRQALNGHRWLEGRCLELSSAVSYWPFLDLLRLDLGWQAQKDGLTNRLRVENTLQAPVSSGYLTAGSAKDISTVLNHLLSTVGEPGQENPFALLTPDEIRQRTFLALRDYLLALAHHQPLVLVYEDLHWADPLSMELIYFLMESLAQAPILLIAVYRPDQEYRTHHLLNIAERKCPGAVTEIRLHELSQPQSGDLIDALLGESHQSERIKSLIWERCQGNPFYIEEVIQSLIEAGVIFHENDHWQVAPEFDAHELPASVQSVILSRLDHLEEDYRQVLQTAAVIGRVFSKKVLMEALSGGLDLEKAIWELEGRGLIYQERAIPEVEYSFRHVLMQEAIYHNSLRHRRKLLHQNVAETIERLYSDRLEEHYEQLAFHFEKSGKIHQTIDYLFKAGEKAVALFSNDAAIAHFSKGLELLRSLPETLERNRQEINFLTALAVPLVHTRGHADDQILETQTQARDLCQKTGDTAHLFEILLGLRRYRIARGNIAEAVHLSRQMLELGENHGNRMEQARSCMMLSEALYYAADFVSLVECSRKGLALCQDQDPYAHIRLYGNDTRLGCQMLLPQALWLSGFPDQALEEVKHEQVMLEGIHHPFNLAMGLYFTLYSYELMSQFNTTKTLAEKLLQIAREHGFALYQAWGLAYLGWSLAAQNQLKPGIDCMQQGITLLHDLKFILTLPDIYAHLGEALAQSGEEQAGLATIEKGITISVDTGMYYWLPELYRLKGETMRKMGKEPGAEDCFHMAIDTARQQQARSWELRASASLARMWQAQGKRNEAYNLLHPIYSWFTEGFETRDLIDARTLLDQI